MWVLGCRVTLPGRFSAVDQAMQGEGSDRSASVMFEAICETVHASSDYSNAPSGAGAISLALSFRPARRNLTVPTTIIADDADVVTSVGCRGDSCGNAPAESVNILYKAELAQAGAMARLERP